MYPQLELSFINFMLLCQIFVFLYCGFLHAVQFLNFYSLFIHVLVAVAAVTNGEVVPSEDLKNLPMDGAEWVELFVREMMSASNIDDARTRASRALEVLEKSICARASAEGAQNFHQVAYLFLEVVIIMRV